MKIPNFPRKPHNCGCICDSDQLLVLSRIKAGRAPILSSTSGSAPPRRHQISYNQKNTPLASFSASWFRYSFIHLSCLRRLNRQVVGEKSALLTAAYTPGCSADSPGSPTLCNHVSLRFQLALEIKEWLQSSFNHPLTLGFKAPLVFFFFFFWYFCYIFISVKSLLPLTSPLPPALWGTDVITKRLHMIVF